MSINSSKAQLRLALAQQRRDLTAAQRMAAADGLLQSLEQIPEFLLDRKIAGYWAIGGEIPLHRVLPVLQQREQGFYLPVIDVPSKGYLKFAQWAIGDQVEPNRCAIPEPLADVEKIGAEQLDLVLLPLLGFDRQGNRLGMGGGYYDRSFAFLKNAVRPSNPVLVGVAYGFQEIKAMPVEEWDVGLDFIATDTELIQCFSDQQ